MTVWGLHGNELSLADNVWSGNQRIHQCHLDQNDVPTDEIWGGVPETVDWDIEDATIIADQTRCEMHGFALQSIEPPASPQWLDRLKAEDASVVIAVLPVAWVGTWHENPKPQWIIPLSGRWFVQTTDGKRVEMGPGELSFGEDQNAKPDAKGHKGKVMRPYLEALL